MIGMIWDDSVRFGMIWDDLGPFADLEELRRRSQGSAGLAGGSTPRTSGARGNLSMVPTFFDVLKLSF